MFQYNYYRPTKRIDAGSVARADNSHQRALLLWGEHCIECAAPDCYRTCDLYTPTETGRCRRFEGGIIRAQAPEGMGAEIAFKRWGKLEAQGNVRLFSSGTARLLGIAFDLLLRVAGFVGRIMSAVQKGTGSNSYAEGAARRLNAWLSRNLIGNTLPNALVVVALNPENRPCDLLLTVSIDKVQLNRAVRADQLPPPVTLQLILPSGSSNQEISLEAAATIFQSGLPFLIALAPSDEATPRFTLFELEVIHIPFGASPMPVAGATDKPAKLVIFDLDNTLWEGVLLEGAVQLREGVRELFASLDRRGILLSVASKNLHDDALAQLESFGLAEYLLYPQIGWLPKSRSVKEIVDAIDIGIDTAIFVDDNAFERAEVASVYPHVEVLAETALVDLLNHPRLKGANTPDARNRRSMYKSAIQRDQLSKSFGGDYIDFLADSELRLVIRPDEGQDRERITELVQRTNQLNFSGRKYDRAAIAEALTDARLHLVIECSDKFGNYGMVGFCMARNEPAGEAGCRLILDDLMLSCRVQGKFIEKALLANLVRRAQAPVEEILVNFVKTERNRPAQLVLEEIGFESLQQGAYRLDPRIVDLSVGFMTIEAR